MKNSNWKIISGLQKVRRLKFFRVMRIALFFIAVSITQVFAVDSHGQANKLSLNFMDQPIQKILEEIEEKSEFSFMYDATMVDLSQKKSIRCKDQSIEKILDDIFQNTGIIYKIDDQQIALKRQPEIVHQEQPGNKVTGKVTDAEGETLPGVTITVLGTSRGVISDDDGTYSIEVAPTDRLVFSFIGMESQIIDVGAKKTIDVQMAQKTEELDDVTVVAFSRQKKESVIASIETVEPAELRIPASNLTTALAGRMSGVISYQRSGEPGQDNAEFFIRGVTTFGYKKNPLILIDGIELSANDLSRLHPDDIAAFSIMKDATATSLYGARGANGVILVTTKEGREGKAKVSVRFENSISQPTQDIKLADPITYMNLHNEAVRTRDPLGQLPYSPGKIENTELGTNPYVYPATDWRGELLKDYTMNQRLNFNINGGGKVARYYLSGGVTQDNGILDVDKRNDFNSNINLKRYLIRSNININMTNTTEAVVRVHGTFDDYRGPLKGGQETYADIMRSNPVLFPAYYNPDEKYEFTDHILFGNYGDGGYINPYAEMVKGYKEYSQSLMLAQFELKQDLNFFTEGLRFRLLGNTTRNAYFDVSRSYTPFFYSIANYDNRADNYSLRAINPDTGREYLDYQEGPKRVSSTFYAESAIDYNRTFSEIHTVTGLLVGIMRQELIGNAGDLQQSLPFRNLGLSGRLTYAYNTKYFLEFNFGYNGTERFSKNERFGFFPSAGLGWILSKEKFWEPLSTILTEFKVKLTHGIVGNDAIGSASDRFFYLSNVNLDDGGRGYTWGADGSYSRPGISISRYGNDKITWETATKTNLGLEFSLLKKIQFDVDLFKEYRTNILMDRLQFSTFGLQANTRANVGEASSKGVDMSVDVQHYFNNDFWLTARGNFTYARGVFEKYEEPNYSENPWLSRVGQPITQQWGFIAERLFIDDAEVFNAPEQQLGSIVMGGDIKYHDINGDDKISSLDQVPIGHPITPEIIYGFGVSTGYKSWDLSFFFQGSARSSFWIDASATTPFVSDNALLQVYADSHWSESNRDVYSLWPRFSDEHEANNLVRNTWFMQDGSFLRLKSAEFGYTIPPTLYSRYGVEDLRIYFSGTNLLTFSRFKMWDPEMGGNGLGYPVQRVLNAGIQVSF